jgi:hypothetical protein
MKRTLLLAAVLAAALAGCPGSLEDPGRFDEQFGTCPDVPTYLATSCGTTGCHAATNSAGGLDLASADLATRLDGKKASGGTGLLIDPSSPDQSVLYTKLTASPPFGSRMPLGGAPLDDTTVSCVLTWIETSTKGGSP